MTAVGGVLALVAGALGYAIGSISSGYIVGRAYRNVDLRSVGSGSTGATNTLRTLGPGAAALVAVLDVLKGVLAVRIAMSLVTEPEWRSLALALAALGVIVGHCWPAFLAGRGGRGVATGFGAAVLLAWPAWVATVPIFILAIAWTRIVSVGSLAAAAAMVVCYLLSSALGVQPFDAFVLAYLVLGAGIVTWRHRANVARIAAGSEPRLGEGSVRRV